MAVANKNVNILLKLNDQFTSKMKKAGKITDEQRRAMDKCASSAMKFSRTVRTGAGNMIKSIGKAAAALAGISFAGITAGFIGLAESTEEYRKAMGKLNTAYQAAGYSAETGQKAYSQFYAILGDTDTATEASQLLSKLTQNEQDVSKWTRIAAGVNGTFGDSLPIEGLIEATNETAKVGKVTGVLADALNWSGISEDKFNEKLAAAGSEAARNKLIMETLAGTYEGAAAAFYENNKALVKARQSEVAMQKVTGTLGEASVIAKGKLWELFGVAEDGSIRSGSALEWIMQKSEAFKAKIESIDVSQYSDKITAAIQKIETGFSTAWGYVKPVATAFIQNADTIIPLILKVVAAVSALSIVADIAGKVMTVVKAAKSAIAVIKLAGSGLTALMGPVGLAITIGLLLAGVFVKLYQKSETFRNFVNKLGNGIKNFVLTLRDAFVQMKNEIVGVFDKIKQKIKSAVEKIREFLQPMIDLIDKIKTGLSNLGFGSSANTGSQYSLTANGGKATGTPYFRGGLTRVNEGGRGEIMNLPNGTQIIPHDVAKKQQKANNVSVQVTIQGNVIGNRAFMEQTGAYIANKILAAQGVV